MASTIQIFFYFTYEDKNPHFKTNDINKNNDIYTYSQDNKNEDRRRQPTTTNKYNRRTSTTGITNRDRMSSRHSYQQKRTFNNFPHRNNFRFSNRFQTLQTSLEDDSNEFLEQSENTETLT